MQNLWQVKNVHGVSVGNVQECSLKSYRRKSQDIKVSGSEIPYSLTVGQTQLLAGHVEEAHAHATGALALARRRQERGHRAYALRLLGKIAARHKPPERDQAEAHYQQALTLVEELGMRPLAAHCHRSLGQLYVRLGRRDDARTELSAAIEWTGAFMDILRSKVF
jgi:tetratricopeptide (TPR) repeat protein